MKPGSTRTQAAGELNLLAQRFATAHPESEKDSGFRFEPAGSLPPKDRTTLMMFLAGLSAVALLVLASPAPTSPTSLWRRLPAAGRKWRYGSHWEPRAAVCCARWLTESVLLALGGGWLASFFRYWLPAVLRPSTSRSSPARSHHRPGFARPPLRVRAEPRRRHSFRTGCRHGRRASRHRRRIERRGYAFPGPAGSGLCATCW